MNKRKLQCGGCNTDFSGRPECTLGWFVDHKFSCTVLRITLPPPDAIPEIESSSSLSGEEEVSPIVEEEEEAMPVLAVLDDADAEEEDLKNVRNIRRKHLKVKRSASAFLPRALPSIATQSALEFFGTDEKFNVILADPPWRYESSRVGRFGCAEHHYDTMTAEDIWAMPVADLAAPDCMCLIWATGPKFPEAVLTMQHWGFDYKTIFMVWEKVTQSTGEPIKNGISNYTRSCTEFIIVGTKPKSKLSNLRHEERRKRVQQLLKAPRSEHSRKPIEAIKRIDAFCQDGLKKIELFAREAKGPDWAIWGNEVDKFPQADDD